MKPVIIAYIPVLHRGYKNFLEKHKKAESLFLITSELDSGLDYLNKEIRALSADDVKTAINSWGLGFKTQALTLQILKNLAQNKQPIIIPREDISDLVAKRFLPENPVEIDEIFLRWDRNNTLEERSIATDKTIRAIDFGKHIAEAGNKEAELSSDWWRQVGAVAFKGSQILLSGHNRHLPTDHQPYFDGDPRNAFSKGTNIELSIAIHAEASVIAQAAKEGISLNGTEMYVTTFPCPPCAKLIAESGIKTLYFSDGYGVLDGQNVLKNAGVKLVKVEP